MSDCLTARNGALKVRQLQRALYRKSKQEKEVRFYSLSNRCALGGLATSQSQQGRAWNGWKGRRRGYRPRRGRSDRGIAEATTRAKLPVLPRQGGRNT